MKRFHLNMTVSDLDASIAYYSALFDTAPTVNKPDYAKWLLDDPQLNFSITNRGDAAGINHIGLQLDQSEDLEAIRGRLDRVETSTFDQENALCCYARSDKAWASDPDGISWENFVTHDLAEQYGSDGADPAPTSRQICCA